MKCKNCKKEVSGNDICDYCYNTFCLECRWEHNLEKCKKDNFGFSHPYDKRNGVFTCDCVIGTPAIDCQKRVRVKKLFTKIIL